MALLRKSAPLPLDWKRSTTGVCEETQPEMGCLQGDDPNPMKDVASERLQTLLLQEEKVAPSPNDETQQLGSNGLSVLAQDRKQVLGETTYKQHDDGLRCEHAGFLSWLTLLTVAAFKCCR